MPVFAKVSRTMKRNPAPETAVVHLIEGAENRDNAAHRATLTEAQTREREIKVFTVGETLVEIERRSHVEERVGNVTGFAYRESQTRADFMRVLDALIAERVDSVHFHVLLGASEAAEIANWLAESGFTRGTRWVKWIMPTAEAPPVSDEHDIRLIGASEGMAFARIVAENYHYKPEMDLTSLAAEVDAPGFVSFLAYVDDKPIATGRFHGADNACVFGYGTTLRGYRKRGIQGAIIAARLHRARALGYEWATASTMGDDRSSRNLARHGFLRAYETRIYNRSPGIL